jgi:hypothetical protein
MKVKLLLKELARFVLERILVKVSSVKVIG